MTRLWNVSLPEDFFLEALTQNFSTQKYIFVMLSMSQFTMKVKNSKSWKSLWAGNANVLKIFNSGYFDFEMLHLEEKVRTTKITMSKTKKNIEKFGDDHYIKTCPLVDHYYDITTTTKKRLSTLWFYLWHHGKRSQRWKSKISF